MGWFSNYWTSRSRNGSRNRFWFFNRSVARNPSLKAELFRYAILGFALTGSCRTISVDDVFLNFIPLIVFKGNLFGSEILKFISLF